MPGTAPARQCQGIAASGYRCRNRTSRPGGWCGRCRPRGSGSPSATAAVTGRLDEALPPPDPFIGQRAGGWVAGVGGACRLTVDGDDTPMSLVAETQIVDTLTVGPPSVRWEVFFAHRGPVRHVGRLIVADGVEAGWDAATTAAEISFSRFCAARSDASPEALEAIAASGDVGAAVAAANPACPPELLSRLAAESASDDVVWAVAANPSTPAETLAVVVDDPGGWVTRVRVAQNPSAPPATLAELAADPEPAVRDAARANPRFADPGIAAHAGLLTN